jgi:8-oxo-dGTP pyrophosphatase MutT (NUDIX family)
VTQAPFSAGVVVLRRTPDVPRLLLLRAYRNWDFPKGQVEAGELPLEAALRETREETGIDDLVFAWGEGWRETEPYGPRGKIARYYLAETARQHIRLPVSPELGRPEHHEWRWVDLAGARALVPPRLQPVLDWVEATLAGPM